MKCNLENVIKLPQTILLIGFVSTLMAFTVLGQTNNSADILTPWKNDKSFMWSAETNNFSTGVESHEEAPNTVVIWVYCSKKAGLNYVYPPNGKTGNLELCGVDREIIMPKDNKPDTELPQRISVSDLRQNQNDGLIVGHGKKYNYFQLGLLAPGKYREFKVSEVYQIKKEADYTLTVFPVIYKFDTNAEYLERVDLPCVSTKIHLVPSQ